MGHEGSVSPLYWAPFTLHSVCSCGPSDPELWAVAVREAPSAEPDAQPQTSCSGFLGTARPPAPGHAGSFPSREGRRPPVCFENLQGKLKRTQPALSFCRTALRQILKTSREQTEETGASQGSEPTSIPNGAGGGGGKGRGPKGPQS